MDLSTARTAAALIHVVSLREEGVDLSCVAGTCIEERCRLPPRGGSGFKPLTRIATVMQGSLPPRGGSGFKQAEMALHGDTGGLPPRGGSGFKRIYDCLLTGGVVSLREEGVDLSQNSMALRIRSHGLPPRGGSGFKQGSGGRQGEDQASPSARREWI